jgi:trimeric autotransporter adhesin
MNSIYQQSKSNLAKILLLLSLAIAGILIATSSHSVHAVIPDIISYQGLLTSAGGPANGNHDIKVKFYSASAAGTNYYEEQFATIPVNAGIFGLNLGTGALVSGSFANIDFNSPVYITLNVKSSVAGAYDGEMNPRILLRSVPYSLNTKSLAGKSVGGPGGIVAYDATTSITTNNLTGTGNIINSGTLTNTGIITAGTGLTPITTATGTLNANALTLSDASLKVTGTSLSVQNSPTGGITTTVSGLALAINPTGGLTSTGSGLGLSTSCAINQSLKWDGTNWICATYTDSQTLSFNTTTRDLTILGGNTVTIPNTIYTAGTGLSLTGTTFANTGLLSIATSTGTTGLTLTPTTTAGAVTQVLSGTLATANGGTGLTTVGTAGQVLTSNGTTLSYTTPTVTAANVTGAGNLTTTTTGLTIGNGTGATLTAATVNYNLATGIAGLTAGAQGTLGGTGTANTYVGADGLLHLLPNAAAALANLTAGTGLTGGPYNGSTAQTLTVAYGTTAGTALQGSTAPAATCTGTQRLSWNGTAFVCTIDIDTTYTAGIGIALTGTQFSNTGLLSLTTGFGITNTGTSSNPILSSTLSLANIPGILVPASIAPSTSNGYVLTTQGGATTWAAVPASAITVQNTNSLFATGLTTGPAGAGSTAQNSIFLGLSAGQAATNANFSFFLGSTAGYNATNAAYSTFIGNGAGSNATNATNSIFIGSNAGQDDGVNNVATFGTSILIGSDTNTGGFSNSIVLGSGGSNTKVDQLLIPTSYTNLSIGGVEYSVPTIQGTAGQVLTNNGTGLLSWGSIPANSNFANADLTASDNRYHNFNNFGLSIQNTTNFEVGSLYTGRLSAGGFGSASEINYGNAAVSLLAADIVQGANTTLAIDKYGFDLQSSSNLFGFDSGLSLQYGNLTYKNNLTGFLVLDAKANGNITFGSYPSNRNDPAANALLTPTNFLYTSNAGELLSAPLSSIAGTNFATANLTATGNRVHDFTGKDLSIINGASSLVSLNNYTVPTIDGSITYNKFVGQQYKDANQTVTSGIFEDPNFPYPYFRVQGYDTSYLSQTTLDLFSQYFSVRSQDTALGNTFSDFTVNPTNTSLRNNALTASALIEVASGQVNTTSESADGLTSSGISVLNGAIKFSYVDGGINNGGYSFPRSNGSAGQILTTDGAGQLSWQGGGIPGANFATANLTATGDRAHNFAGNNLAISNINLLQLTSINDTFIYSKQVDAYATDQLNLISNGGLGNVNITALGAFQINASNIQWFGAPTNNAAPYVVTYNPGTSKLEVRDVSTLGGGSPLKYYKESANAPPAANTVGPNTVVAIGSGNIVNGQKSGAFGNDNSGSAYSAGNFYIGNNNTNQGGQDVAIVGSNNNVNSGYQTIIAGYNNSNPFAGFSGIFGNNNTTNGYGSFALGAGLINNLNYSVDVGTANATKLTVAQDGTLTVRGAINSGGSTGLAGDVLVSRGVAQSPIWQSLGAVTGGVTLNGAYNYGGSAAGNQINVIGTNPGVHIKADGTGGPTTAVLSLEGSVNNTIEFNVGNYVGAQDRISFIGSSEAKILNDNKLSLTAGQSNLELNSVNGLQFTSTLFATPQFSVANNGTTKLNAYTSARNDSGTTAPLNFLYTDAAGSLLSAPIALLGGGGSTLNGAYNYGGLGAGNIIDVIGGTPAVTVSTAPFLNTEAFKVIQNESGTGLKVYTGNGRGANPDITVLSLDSSSSRIDSLNNLAINSGGLLSLYAQDTTITGINTLTLQTYLNRSTTIANYGENVLKLRNDAASVESYIAVGNGSPEGMVTANTGSLYQRGDGIVGEQLYLKTTNGGKTGWVTIGGPSVGGVSPITIQNGSSLFATGLPNPAGLGSLATGSVFLGDGAGNLSTNASNSNFIGNFSGFSATNANASNFFGGSAGSQATNASYSNFIGQQAGYLASEAYISNFMGLSAGQSAINANYSNFFGINAGKAATNAANSTFIGSFSGENATYANDSIFIGNKAGFNDIINNSLGGSSILVGNNTNTGGFSNSIALGANAFNTNTDQFAIGDSYTKLRIGGVDYTVPVTQATASGQVLTNNGNGLLSWQNAAGASGCTPTGTGVFNYCLGVNNLRLNTTGSSNIAIGSQALEINTTGGQNVAVGYQTLQSNTSGADNTGIGGFALGLNTTGVENTGIGLRALNRNSSGKGNTGVGFESGYFNSTGEYNTSLGYQALRNNDIGNYNSAIGYSALSNSTGWRNTAIGLFAGYNLLSGNKNIAIGPETNFANANGSFQLNIGNAIFGTGLNGTVNAPAGNIGIGTNAPTAKLEVASDFANTSGLKFSSLTSASPTSTGQALGVDASGNVVTIAGASSTTASNGLSQLSNTITLGGTLIQNTTIDQSGNPLTISNGTFKVIKGKTGFSNGGFLNITPFSSNTVGLYAADTNNYATATNYAYTSVKENEVASTVYNNVSLSGGGTVVGPGTTYLYSNNSSNGAAIDLNSSSPTTKLKLTVSQQTPSYFGTELTQSVNGLQFSTFSNSSFPIVFNVGNTGNLSFTGSLQPNNNAGSAGQVLTSQGVGVAPIWTTASSNPLAFVNGGNSFGGLSSLGTNDAFDQVFKTNNVERLRISSTGQIGINTTPFSSARLTVRASGIESPLDVIGNDSQFAGRFFAGSTIGQSFGPYISAGTNASDAALVIRNATAASNYLFVRGNGNVGIGNGSPNAKLEVTSGLTDTSGLRFTNLTSASALTTGQQIGVDASGNVVTIAGGSVGWGLTGNAGTNPLTNYLGTSDLQALVLKTNNVDRARFDTAGNFVINKGVSNPVLGSDFTVLNATGGFATAEIKGGSSGGATLLKFTNDTGYQFAIGEGGSTNNSFANGSFVIRDQNAGLNRIVVAPNGNVGIGDFSGVSNYPTVKLQVAGGLAATRIDATNQVTNTGFSVLGAFTQSNSTGSATYTNLVTGQNAINNMFIEVANQANVKGALGLQPYGGNVGIGTNTPTTTLEINTTIANDSGLKLSQLTSASPTSTGQAIGVDASGKVVTIAGGAGVTSYCAGTQIPGGPPASGTNSFGAACSGGNDVGAANQLSIGTKSFSGLNIITNNVNRISIGDVGGVTVYSTLSVTNPATNNVALFSGTGATQCTIVTGTGISCSSDVRLKQNIVSLDPATSLINQLKPVTYQWKVGSTDTQTGFIAQDVEAVIPGLVSTNSDGYKSLNTSGIIPYLVKAFQEQSKEIEAIKAKLGLNTALPSSELSVANEAKFADLYSQMLEVKAKNTEQDKRLELIEIQTQKIKTLEEQNQLYELRLKKLEQSILGQVVTQ